MKLFKKKVLTPRSKRKVFDVYNENTTNTGSPRKVKRTEDKENADAGLNTSRKLASMAVNLKDKVTRPFSAHEQNFAVTSIDMENDYEFNKKLYQVDNPTGADRTEGGADFDDLLGKEQLSPPRVQLDCSNVFSPAKRVLTTDKTRKLVHRSIFTDRIEEQQDETGTSYDNFEELSAQIRLSFNDKRFSDVVIRCGMALEHKFYAHRIILANRSRYFESVFAASALELKSGRFCIDKPAMFAEIFAKVLEYMYTGYVHLHLDNVLEVLSMSEEFGIDSLKSLCEKYITQNIDVNNACLLLELSRQYRAQPLSNFVLRFIDSRENVKAVLASEACSALSKETLQCIIERDTLQLSNTEEVNIFQAVLSWIKKNGDSQIDDILGLIRFPIMTPQQLSDIVEPQGLVPQELLFEAYRHHLVPQKSNHFHRFMQRNRVPVPELSVSGPTEQEKASEEQDDDLADIRLDDSVEMRE